MVDPSNGRHVPITYCPPGVAWGVRWWPQTLSSRSQFGWGIFQAGNGGPSPWDENAVGVLEDGE
jgi:hypothetical protein